MPHFVSHDPPQLYHVSAIAFHESAHLLLAYYYGFLIERFRTLPIPGGMTGALRAFVSPALERADPAQAYVVKAQQLIAAEVAARQQMGLALDELVLPVKNAQCIDGTVPLNVVRAAITEDRHDISRVLELAAQAAVPNWWNWVWVQHAHVVAFLNVHNELLPDIAALTHQAFASPDRCIGYRLKWLLRHAPAFVRPAYWPKGTSIISGRYLVRQLKTLGAPIADTSYLPKPC